MHMHTRTHTHIPNDRKLQMRKTRKKRSKVWVFDRQPRTGALAHGRKASTRTLAGT